MEDAMTQERWTSENMGDQDGRVAIVTGSNSGIGKVAAGELARKGATVVMAVRDVTRGEEAAAGLRDDRDGGDLVVMELDLADLASVRAFTNAYRQRFDRLDLLVNNAGVMMPPASRTADGFELQFGTNHLGHFALTGRLMDLLLATEGSRVVTVSSMAHKWGGIDFDDLQWEKRNYSKGGSYGQSKLANLLFTYELQRRLDLAGVDTIATAAHPGWTATNLQRSSGLFRMLNPLMAMKPWQGALPTLMAATGKEVRGGEYYGPRGFQEMRGYPGQVDSNEASRDEGTARRLWEVSEQLTGVSFDALAGGAGA
jgi:NAD(P)-dependent dehydrogenase (short-subunit alcohol dehydrogenase family)